MPADHRTRITQACVSCKVRKKKCNREFPSCSYCLRKDLDCRYAPVPRRRLRVNLNTDVSPQTARRPDTLSAEVIDDVAHNIISSRHLRQLTPQRASLYRPIFESLDGVFLEVQNIIRSTGEFVDDLTARYFRNFHSHLPIISRTRFQNNLIATGAPPSAEGAILLLTVCLIACSTNIQLPRQVGDTPLLSRRSLYLATKAILAQIQGSLPPSISLIQATLLLATYEYAIGQPEVALATIAGCARMGYAARVHKRNGQNINGESELEGEEAGNTWWGIVISERAFFCEADNMEQPTVSILPPGDARLPIDSNILDRADLLSASSIPSIPVSCLMTPNVGGFGRAAQASCLLDQVFKALVIQDLDTRLPMLESIDRTIQSLLGLALTHSPDRGSPYCTALSLTLRALFKLHSHIMNLPEQVVYANLRSLEDWKKSSLAALDTATTIVIDMSKSHYSYIPSDGTNDTSPVNIYVVRAAINHLQARSFDEAPPWSETAKDELVLYLDRLGHEWTPSRG